jgi:hypothetical protein
MASQLKGIALGVLGIVFMSMAILAGIWAFISWTNASGRRAELANSTAILALIENIGEREVVRRHVRRTEAYADLVWRDARGDVRRARVHLERERLVEQAGRHFYPVRYFENDRSRQPMTMTDAIAASIINSADHTLLYSLLVVVIGVVGLLAVYLKIASYPRISGGS